MTTVSDAMNRAARECSLSAPSSWISATQLAYQELRDDFLAETVDELLDRVDWPSPIGKVQTITGDGSEDYDLSPDFRRLARDPMAVYETTTTRRAAIPVTSDGDWEHLSQLGTAAGNRYYRLGGYDGASTIGFYRNPTSAAEIKVSYVSNLWMATAAGTAGSAWTDATDVLLLPRRLIELGVVWRFRQRKGLPYDDRLAEYEARLSRAANDARGRRVIGFSDAPTRSPFDIPVPDWIPGS